MSSSVIEKELTCSICTDILFDPVTFLDCLHANCGACAKSWFASLNNSGSSSNRFTCPACRAVVKEARAGGLLQNLVDDFVKSDPSKDRTLEEKRKMRSLYKPGDKVLPLAGGSSSTPPVGAPRLSQNSPTPSFRIPPPIRLPPGNAFHGSLFPLQTSPNSGPFPQPIFPIASSPGSSLTSSFEQLSVTRDPECHRCSKSLKFAVRGICATCEEAFCTHCYRVNEGCGSSSPPSSSSSSPPHVVIFQKQRPLPQSISFGLFCVTCESFCGGPNGALWLCSSCHSSGDDELWGYCSVCVGKGNCCTHDLELYTKPPRHLVSASPQSPAMEILHQVQQHKRLVSQGDSPNTPRARILARGYTRQTGHWVNCDFCHRRISPDSAFLHCTLCRDGTMDICMQCYDVTRSDADPNSATFRCPQGHNFTLLTQSGNPGSQKVILSPPHDPPEMIPRGQNLNPWTAVALKGHWPDEENSSIGSVSMGDRPGVRMWEYGDQLAFPEGAEIRDVALAFTEEVGSDRVTYYWGWYGGVGGLFEGEYVRIVD
ncbi:unnamed protein product [Tuber melanosporum]|uniref:(Perigord truffle) hypothetical protein n=1 Tax=Tuber melanosporum (strain Mel28) TaxID=656061 RepID=D5GLX3_TUBMM|nr:uncharacterized protein GSTUM_00010460001 [Tuber melanosporum]CAZ85540.1 unnamed protein product [Tuber melanosporum]